MMLRRTLLALAVQAITIDAGLVGLRDAFFGTGSYAIATMDRRAGGIANPDRCTGIENAKRFQPHQPYECRMLEVTGAGAVLHGGWNYCPEDPKANCYIPMACVDEDNCKDNKCGLFDNPEYTTISCSNNFYCGHTAIVDKASPELDATRWVCNPTQGLAITIAGGMKVINNIRSFDGRIAEVETATTFVPGKTLAKSLASSTPTSTSTSSTEPFATITSGPPVMISTATLVITPTNAPATNREKANMAPIIGGAVGGAAALGLIGFVIFLLIRRRRRSKVPAPTVLSNFHESTTSTISEKNTSDSNNPPGSVKTLGSNWQPSPATTQEAWSINANNGCYSGVPNEMPTPEMLSRDWTQQTPQQTLEGPYEMSSTPAAAVSWGNGSLSHKAQGWVDQKQTLQFQGGGLDRQQQTHPAPGDQRHQLLHAGQPMPLNMNAVLLSGSTPSLISGRTAEHRAELG